MAIFFSTENYSLTIKINQFNNFLDKHSGCCNSVDPQPGTALAVRTPALSVKPEALMDITDTQLLSTNR